MSTQRPLCVGDHPQYDASLAAFAEDLPLAAKGNTVVFFRYGTGIIYPSLSESTLSSIMLFNVDSDSVGGCTHHYMEWGDAKAQQLRKYGGWVDSPVDEHAMYAIRILSGLNYKYDNDDAVDYRGKTQYDHDGTIVSKDIAIHMPHRLDVATRRWWKHYFASTPMVQGITVGLDLGQQYARRHEIYFSLTDTARFLRNEMRRCDRRDMSVAAVLTPERECYRYDENGMFGMYCRYGVNVFPKNAAKRK